GNRHLPRRRPVGRRRRQPRRPASRKGPPGAARRGDAIKKRLNTEARRTRRKIQRRGFQVISRLLLLFSLCPPCLRVSLLTSKHHRSTRWLQFIVTPVR